MRWSIKASHSTRDRMWVNIVDSMDQPGDGVIGCGLIGWVDRVCVDGVAEWTF